ncbi:MAG TPA: AcvB/VirJ family lysyl-phosphatidylglycerol hydrolase [Thermoanaerobaculia bacterium]|jgi:type IV secretory pathway VirJ component
MFQAALLALALLVPAPPAATARKPVTPPTLRSAPERVKGVPLIEVPARAPGGGEMAVLLSGDGGWAVTDKGLSERLAKGGIPVAGWNALRYFIRRKKPDRVARDLERVLRVYLPLWHKEKVILIGYSFGADVVPFLVNRLPPDLAEQVSLVVLVGPTGTADFHFHPSEWLRKPSDDSLPLLPEIEKLRGREILCAYGQKEKHSFCLDLPEGLVHLLIRPGGHIVGKDYGPIADWILGDRAAGASPGGGVGAQ